MSEIVSENPISLSEVKEMLKKIEERSTLEYRAERVKKYLENLDLLDLESAKKMEEELKNLNLPFLRKEHIVKLIDIRPETPTELRAVLYGESLKEEDIKKILEVIKKYL